MNPLIVIAFFASVLSSSALAQTGEQPIASYEDILKLVPREMVVDLRGSKQKEMTQKINDLLLEKTKGRPISIDLKFDHVQGQLFTSGKENTHATMQRMLFRAGGVQFEGWASVTFAAAEAPKLAKLKSGQKVRLEGIMNWGLIVGQWSPIPFQVQLSEVKIKN